jgi:hypothetical protein
MTTHTPRAISRVLVFGLLLCGLLALAGCGPDYKARGTVKGKVTTGKQLLTTGTVVFHNSNGITSTAHIDTEGNYTMNDAPVGDVRITVTVNVPPPMMSKKIGPFAGPAGKAVKGMESKDPEGVNPGIAIMGKMPDKIVRIDDKYSNPDTSGLTYKVERGEHTYDIELAP